MTNTYTTEDCKTALQKLDLPWELNESAEKMYLIVPTDNFLASLALATEITVWAEALQHHPDLELTYGQVKITLSTHDAQGITTKDITLANKIDALIGQKKRG